MSWSRRSAADNSGTPFGSPQIRKRQTMHVFNGSQVALLTGLLQELSGSGQQYTDSEFGPERGSLGPTVAHPSDVDWRRAAVVLGPEHDVFTDGIEPDDIKQGGLGDCYFLAALSVLADPQVTTGGKVGVSGRVERIFLPEFRARNSAGLYAARVFANGIPTIVALDDRIPVYKSTGRPICSSAHGPELWVMLLEKCYAKCHGGYQKIVSGNAKDALADLTGAPYHKLALNNNPRAWKDLLLARLKHFLLTCSIRSDIPEATAKSWGLVSDHAYAIVDAIDVHGIKLVKVRNPWGNREWTGRFSDSDDAWTPQLRAFVGLEVADDGAFWMEFKDFSSWFENVDISSYRDNWSGNYEHYTLNGFGTRKKTILELTVTDETECYLSIFQNRHEQEVSVRVGVLHGTHMMAIGSTSNVFLESRVVSTSALHLDVGRHFVVIEIYSASPQHRQRTAVVGCYASSPVKISACSAEKNVDYPWDENSAPELCEKCLEPLGLGYVLFGGGKIHSACFCCAWCKKELSSSYDDGGQLSCLTCMQSLSCRDKQQRLAIMTAKRDAKLKVLAQANERRERWHRAHVEAHQKREFEANRLLDLYRREAEQVYDSLRDPKNRAAFFAQRVQAFHGEGDCAAAGGGGGGGGASDTQPISPGRGGTGKVKAGGRHHLVSPRGGGAAASLLKPDSSDTKSADGVSEQVASMNQLIELVEGGLDASFAVAGLHAPSFRAAASDVVIQVGLLIEGSKLLSEMGVGYDDGSVETIRFSILASLKAGKELLGLPPRTGDKTEMSNHVAKAHIALNELKTCLAAAKSSKGSSIAARSPKASSVARKQAAASSVPKVLPRVPSPSPSPVIGRPSPAIAPLPSPIISRPSFPASPAAAARRNQLPAGRAPFRLPPPPAAAGRRGGLPPSPAVGRRGGLPPSPVVGRRPGGIPPAAAPATRILSKSPGRSPFRLPPAIGRRGGVPAAARTNINRGDASPPAGRSPVPGRRHVVPSHPPVGQPAAASPASGRSPAASPIAHPRRQPARPPSSPGRMGGLMKAMGQSAIGLSAKMKAAGRSAIGRLPMRTPSSSAPTSPLFKPRRAGTGNTNPLSPRGRSFSHQPPASSATIGSRQVPSSSLNNNNNTEPRLSDDSFFSSSQLSDDFFSNNDFSRWQPEADSNAASSSSSTCTTTTRQGNIMITVELLKLFLVPLELVSKKQPKKGLMVRQPLLKPPSLKFVDCFCGSARAVSFHDSLAWRCWQPLVRGECWLALLHR